MKSLTKTLRSHSRVLSDLIQAYQMISQINNPGDNLAESWANDARFTSAVINYARSFITSRGGDTYSIKNLKKHEEFDREIHEHLLQVRQKMVAHADEDVFPTEVYVITIDTVTDVPQSLSTAVFSSAFRVAGFTDDAFKSRILRHIEACLKVVNLAWGRDADDFLRQRNSKEFAIDPRLTKTGENTETVLKTSSSISFASEYSYFPNMSKWILPGVDLWLASGESAGHISQEGVTFTRQSDGRKFFVQSNPSPPEE